MIEAGRREMVREFEVLNSLGIHARPASLLVKCASRYDADVSIEKDGSRVSGKSIMGLMTLEAARGTRLKVTVSGPGAEELMDAIGGLFASRFNEE